MEIRETVIRSTDLDEATPWPVSWSAVWVGALASLAAITIFGLYGAALGIGNISDIKDFSTWHEISLANIVDVICGGFFAYVIGGWTAGKITGARIPEPSILHAAIAWLVTIPMLLAALALGAGKTFGGWYGGIIGTVGSSTVALSPLAVRHGAIAAATSLLVGLIGSVIGGWIAGGEAMTFTAHRKRAARRP